VIDDQSEDCFPSVCVLGEGILEDLSNEDKLLDASLFNDVFKFIGSVVGVGGFVILHEQVVYL